MIERLLAFLFPPKLPGAIEGWAGSPGSWFLKNRDRQARCAGKSIGMELTAIFLKIISARMAHPAKHGKGVDSTPEVTKQKELDEPVFLSTARSLLKFA